MRQLVQVVDFAGAYVPAAQSLQPVALLLPFAILPAAQSVQAFACVAAANVPDGQSVQLVCSSAAYLPEGQLLQEVDALIKLE